MQIEDYRKLALSNGLVVMQIDQPLAPYQVGNYAGFSPDEAMFYHKEGIAHPKDGPREYPKSPEPPPPPSPALVPIPKDWRSLNRLQKAQIVAGIHGTALTPSITTKECDNAIEQELAKRSGSFPAVTSASIPPA